MKNYTIDKILSINNDTIIQDTDLIEKNEIFQFIQIQPSEGFNIISLQTNDCMILNTKQNIQFIQLPYTIIMKL